jgi:hypothetical protein
MRGGEEDFVFAKPNAAAVLCAPRDNQEGRRVISHELG